MELRGYKNGTVEAVHPMSKKRIEEQQQYEVTLQRSESMTAPKPFVPNKVSHGVVHRYSKELFPTNHD